MDPSRELGSLTRGFPTAYPNTDTALAWVLCVPHNGFGWRSYEGKSEVSDLYRRRKTVPVVWDMYADGDVTLRRYIESMGTRNRTPLTGIPADATSEWVEACRTLIRTARRVGVAPEIQRRLDRIESTINSRWEVPKPKPVEAWVQEVLNARREANQKDFDYTFRQFRIDGIRRDLEENDREASFRTPKIEAAIKAMDEAGVQWMFEELSDRAKAQGLWGRVVVMHPHHNSDAGILARAARHLREDEDLAQEILTPEQFIQWKANVEWRVKAMPFMGGERSYGRKEEVESLFYNGMIDVQSGPWTWPLINKAIEIFGEPEVAGDRMTFTPLRTPGHFNEDTVGLHQPKRVFEYKYDSWQGGDLTQYAPARFYTFAQLVEGIVVSIGGANYRVIYPLVAKFLQDPDTTDYPNDQAPVIIERTTDPVTKPVSRGAQRRGSEVQFFGKPWWVQDARFPVWKGRAGHVLFTLNDNWGDGGSTNVLFCPDENGVPVRVFHEASCT